MDFKLLLNEKAREYDAYLERLLNSLTGESAGLFEAVKYSVLSGGKRIRMLALLECARMFSDDISDCIPYACAVEMIHTYSLIHDDLPLMDNATYRRGRLCSHKVYGEGTALLAGDALLTYAFEVMSEASLTRPEKSPAYIRAINEIASHAGIRGMVLGQALDTAQNFADSLEDATFIYLKKTAAMFIGPMKAGAIIAGADEAGINAAGECAYNLGLAFQITDDILDEAGNAAELGKDTGRDAANGKRTIASILGLAQSGELARSYADTAAKAAKPYDRHGFFNDLSEFLTNRKS